MAPARTTTPPVDNHIPGESTDTAVALGEIVRALDHELRTADIPDYSGAHNGLQVANRTGITRIATAVDASRDTIRDAATLGANLLIVHHGLFWGGVQPIAGVTYERLRLLFDHDIALYATHLPLDAHPVLGNNVQLATTLGLTPSTPFAEHKGVTVGVAGDSDVATIDLVERTRSFAQRYGGTVRTSVDAAGRTTRRWALCTGGGANTDTLRECYARGIDTLIVGEGPHHTAVDAAEHNLCVVYAGHYATETLGVQAVGNWLSEQYALPSSFIYRPTGL
jgi:dinuclear metal center YbgI/SA1388 family protein